MEFKQLFLEKNESLLDRIIRAVLSLIFLYLGLTVTGLFYILGIILAVTALTGHCTIYSIFKFKTLKQ